MWRFAEHMVCSRVRPRSLYTSLVESYDLFAACRRFCLLSVETADHPAVVLRNVLTAYRRVSGLQSLAFRFPYSARYGMSP